MTIQAAGSDLEQTLESIPFPAWFHEHESKRIRAANAAATEFFGKSHETLLALRSDDIMPPHDTAVLLWLREKLAASKDRPVSIRHQTSKTMPSGEWVEFEVVAIPARLGSTGGMICVVLERDNVIASPFTNSDRELVQTRERFRMVADHMRDVFWIRDADRMRFYYVNAAFERIWGVPPETLYTDPECWIRQVLPEHLSRVERVMQRPIAVGGDWEIEYPIRHVGGEIRWVRSRAFRMTSEAGGDLLVGLCEDVTERRAEEERRLERETHQRTALIREVHHRIKNNLQGVVGLLGMHAASDSVAAPYLKAAIGQVRAIATIHGLHSQPDGVNVRLCDVIEAIGRSVQELYGVTVQTAVPAERNIVLLEGEAVAVALVVHELLTNAVKHRAPDPDIGVISRLTRDGAITSLQVTNPGCLPERFDFAAAGNDGAGLALVKALLPAEGALLRIEQRNGTVEATLELRYPVVVDSGSSAQQVTQ
jgi:PAS domain S-box-containing protein